VKDGKKQWKGKNSIANGNVYDGDLNDDNRNGKGKYKWTDGKVYDGDWKNGEMQKLKTSYTYDNHRQKKKLIKHG